MKHNGPSVKKAPVRLKAPTAESRKKRKMRFHWMMIPAALTRRAVDVRGKRWFARIKERRVGKINKIAATKALKGANDMAISIFGENHSLGVLC